MKNIFKVNGVFVVQIYTGQSLEYTSYDDAKFGANYYAITIDVPKIITANCENWKPFSAQHLRDNCVTLYNSQIKSFAQSFEPIPTIEVMGYYGESRLFVVKWTRILLKKGNEWIESTIDELKDAALLWGIELRF